MRHRTQRWFNRFLFCSCVFLPTLVIAGTLWLRHSDTGQRLMVSRWTSTFERATTSQVEIGRVHFVSPGSYVFEDVSLRDRETGRCIAQCDHIALKMSFAKWEWDVHLARTDCQDLYAWLQWWDSHLLSLKEGPETYVEIQSLKLAGMENSALVDLVARVMPGSRETELLANFGGGVQKPVALKMRRSHAYPIQTEITLETNNHRLPADLLGGLLSDEFQFGGAATFSGQVVAELSSHSPVASGTADLTLQGELRQVDLEHLLQDSKRPPLRGFVNIDIARAEYADGRWRYLQAKMQGTSGTVLRAWLPKVAKQLKLRWLGDVQQPRIAYESLCCEFAWSREGISIRGETAEPYRGSILRHPNGILLADYPDNVIQAASLQDALLR